MEQTRIDFGVLINVLALGNFITIMNENKETLKMRITKDDKEAIFEVYEKAKKLIGEEVEVLTSQSTSNFYESEWFSDIFKKKLFGDEIENLSVYNYHFDLINTSNIIKFLNDREGKFYNIVNQTPEDFFEDKEIDVFQTKGLTIGKVDQSKMFLRHTNLYKLKTIDDYNTRIESDHMTSFVTIKTEKSEHFFEVTQSLLMGNEYDNKGYISFCVDEDWNHHIILFDLEDGVITFLSKGDFGLVDSYSYNIISNTSDFYR